MLALNVMLLASDPNPALKFNVGSQRYTLASAPNPAPKFNTHCHDIGKQT